MEANQRQKTPEELLAGQQAAEQRAAAFLQWRQESQTQRFFQFLEAKLEEQKHCWAKGDFLLDALDSSAIQNAVALGKCRVLSELIEIQPEDLEQ